VAGFYLKCGFLFGVVLCHHSVALLYFHTLGAVAGFRYLAAEMTCCVSYPLTLMAD